MKTIIIANGTLNQPEMPALHDAMIIAADGGFHHCKELGIRPQAIIGDFDSLEANEIDLVADSGILLLRYPADKGETDLELALNFAVKKGATQITLLGLLGGRWDMSFANLLLLASPRFADIDFHVVDGKSEIFILRGEQTLKLHGKSGDLVSVIPLAPETRGFTYTGLEWPLENETLHFGSPRGVSNRMLAENAAITLGSGLAMVFVIHQ